MSSSTVSTSSRWQTTMSLRAPSSSLTPVSTHQTPLGVHPSSHTVLHDLRPNWLCTHHYYANYHSSWSQGQRDASSSSRLVLISNVCPQCQRYPKLPDHRFCSIACRQSAARSAPELKYLHPHHESSIKIATQFIRCWGAAPRPKVLAIYMITWTGSSERRFEQYRDVVEARGQFRRMGYFSGNEQKRFRSTVRACTLGERGNLSPCHNEECWMCETIRWGFEPHLRRKRSIPLNGAGIRLGAGIYTSHTSSKADQYAENKYDPSSSIKAMLVCRVVIGRPFVMYQEDPTLRSPPPGYDCVFGKPGPQSAFIEDEYVVYNADAIRAAYLVMYETAPGA